MEASVSYPVNRSRVNESLVDGRLGFAPAALPSNKLELLGKLVQFLVGEVLDVDHAVAGVVNGMDQLVELQVDGARVAILRVLDEEDHEEGHDGRAGIDDKLPGV